MGGPRIVNSIGDNFKEYIAQWREETKDVAADYAERVTLYSSAPIVKKIQTYLLVANTTSSSASYVSTSAPPAGNNWTDGSAANNYNTT